MNFSKAAAIKVVVDVVQLHPVTVVSDPESRKDCRRMGTGKRKRTGVKLEHGNPRKNGMTTWNGP